MSGLFNTMTPEGRDDPELGEMVAAGIAAARRY